MQVAHIKKICGSRQESHRCSLGGFWMRSRVSCSFFGGRGEKPRRILTGLLCPNLASLKNRLVVLVKLMEPLCLLKSKINMSLNDNLKITVIQTMQCDIIFCLYIGFNFTHRTAQTTPVCSRTWSLFYN